MQGLRKTISAYLRDRPLERKLGRHLIAYFGRRAIHNITRRRIGWYRKARLAAGAAATSVNKEVQLLIRVLAHHGFVVVVKPLPDKPRPIRPITPEEFERLVRIGLANPRWHRALAVAVMAATSGLPRTKLERLTWAQIDPFGPLHPAAEMVLIKLERRRMFSAGRCRPTDLVLNFRNWAEGWRALSRAAGLDGLTVKRLRALQLRP